MYDAGWTRITAFDYAPDAVDRARELFGARAPPSRLVVADATALPCDWAGSFDAALDKARLVSAALFRRRSRVARA